MTAMTPEERIPLTRLTPAELAGCLGTKKAVLRLPRTATTADVYLVCTIRLRFDDLLRRLDLQVGELVRHGHQYEVWLEGQCVSRMALLVGDEQCRIIHQAGDIS